MSRPPLSTMPARPVLSVTTVPIADPGDPIGLLPESDGALAWVRRGEGLVAWGEAARFTAHGDQQMLDADAWLRDIGQFATVRDEVRLPGTGLIGFGSFAFDATDPGGGVLAVPRIVVGRRTTPHGIRAWVTMIDPLDTPSLALDGPRQPLIPPREVTWEAGSVSPPEWMGKVADAVAAIRDGLASKVVLARDAWATSAEPIDARALVSRFVATYPTTWAFAVDGLVGATPELLVRREHGLVTSRVLAGTIRRTGDDEADLAHAAALARSSKDLEEHEFAVASLAHALEPYVASANVPEVPSVLHLPNVMHLATDVTAVLREDGEHPSALHLADALHPTAAVGGTPRRAAVELVRQIEGMDRGRYAGPVGWLGADGDGEFCIALRCGAIEAADPRRIRVFAGCGIVAASDPAAELDETEAKFEPMRQALLG